MIHTISKEVIITTHQKEQMKYLQMTFQKKFLIVAIISACVITFSNAQSCTASLRNLVAKHEGDKLCVYVDTTGHKTIGIGYNLDQGGAKEMIESVGANFDNIYSGKSCLTQSQVNVIFSKTIGSSISGARSAVSSFDSLCCGVQNVMVDMTFNLGVGGFRSFGSFISDINNKEWASAAADMKGTLWCKQVGSRCSDDASYVQRGCSGLRAKGAPTDEKDGWLSSFMSLFHVFI